MSCMMILTTRAVTTEYLVAELSLSVEVDDLDCGIGGGDVVVGGGDGGIGGGDGAGGGDVGGAGGIGGDGGIGGGDGAGGGNGAVLNQALGGPVAAEVPSRRA